MTFHHEIFIKKIIEEANGQWCYSAGTHRNAVPVQIYFGVRRSGSFM
jgi:hypothetical protein